MTVAALAFAGFAFPDALAGPAFAQAACKNLQMVASLDLTMGDHGISAPVSVNGKTAMLHLSTTAGFTSFTPGGAAALGLTPISRSGVVMLSASGKTSESYVVIDDLAAGGVHVQHSQFMVLPDDSVDDTISGVLSGDLLSRYEVELDFANRKMNLFLQDHCPQQVLYWPHAAEAMVPMSTQQPTANNSRSGFQSYIKRDVQMWVPVILDGTPVQALISTGSTSAMDENTATGLMHIDAASPGSAPRAGAADSKVYQHAFKTLVFDGVTVTNPKFTIYPIDDAVFARNWPRTDTRLARVEDGRRPSIVIGMDILIRLHLFASFGEHRLYVTEAGRPAPAASASNGLPATLTQH